MDNNVRKLQTKRFVIEDSYTKVTADGEPHEMMTLIAGLAGVFAAAIILIVLISLVVCRKDGSSHNDCRNCANGMDAAQCAQKKIQKRNSNPNSDAARSSISTVCTGVSSTAVTPSITPDVNTPIDFVVTKGNFGSNLNAAFVESEFDLADSIHKGKKKKMRWHNEVVVHSDDKETVIDMTER